MKRIILYITTALAISLLSAVSFAETTDYKTIEVENQVSVPGTGPLLAGGGAGLKLGHNIVTPKDTPLCNVWLTMLNQMGVAAERHGDSTGMLKEIVA